MVITQERLLDGFAKYAENDFINKIAGPMKWVIAVSISFILSEGLKMIEENKEMLTKMGYLNEDGTIEIDRVYNDFKSVAEKYGNVIMPNRFLGDITFTKSDIDDIYMYCIS